MRSAGLDSAPLVDGLLRKAVFFLKRGKPRQALAVLRKARANDAQNALVYYNLGLSYEAIKRYRKALNSYQRALSLDPTLTDAAVCQGYILGLKGDVKRELMRYDEVLRRDPTHLMALYNKAVALDDSFGNPRAAIPWYLQTLKQPLTKPQQRDVYLRLVYAYLDTRQFRKAETCLKKLI